MQTFEETYLENSIYRIISGIAGIIGFILIWWLIGNYLFSRPAYAQFADFLPLPTFKALERIVFEKYFWASVLASLRRVGVGILLAFCIGLPAGLVIGYYRFLFLVVNPPIQFLRMISPLAWMPIALLLFAGFESAIYFLIVMATIWPIVINTILGISQVNPQWINMARNQGANNRQIIVKIILPASVPHIFTSLRLSLGVAWIVLVPAEFLGVSSGLGYLINDARDTLEYDRLMAIVIAIGFIGYILDAFIHLIQNHYGWRRPEPLRLARKMVSLKAIHDFFFRFTKHLYFWLIMDVLYILIIFNSGMIHCPPIDKFFAAHFYGIFVGTMVMFTGLGAGVLWFPFLTYLGYSPTDIVPLSLFNQIMGKGSGSYKYFNDRMMNGTVIRHFLPYTFLGVTIGFFAGFVIPHQYENWLLLLFCIVVIFLIILMLRSTPEYNLYADNFFDPAGLKKGGIIVTCASFFTGLLSIGNSDWIIPYMEQRLKMPSIRAVASGIFIMFSAALFYLILLIISIAIGIRDWPNYMPILLATASGVIIGGQIGARLCKFTLFRKYQRNVFIMMLSLSVVHMLFEFFAHF